MPVYTAARPPGTIQAFTVLGSSTTVHVHVMRLAMFGQRCFADSSMRLPIFCTRCARASVAGTIFAFFSSSV